LLQQLKIPSAWLIGHSLGGAIALWGAAHHPNCVQGVICLNSGGGIYLKEEFERFRSAGSQLVKLRPRWLAQLPLLDLAFARANVARPMSPSWGRQRLVDFVAAHPEAALRTLLDSTTEQEVHRLPRLVAQLQQPVYFITGSQDDVMLPQYVRHLASYHPLFEGYGANVMEISDCGHLAMVEQPEQVAAQIHDILVNYGTASLLGDRL
jgi:pimeloyl-ACP methyl ester carboxylesterase